MKSQEKHQIVVLISWFLNLFAGDGLAAIIIISS